MNMAIRKFIIGLLITLSFPVLANDVLLGAGDVVRISVYGSPDLTTETRIAENGNITFPFLGQVQIGGLTAASAEKTIAALLESGSYLKRPQVNILVTAFTSQQISVLGQVNRPGRYPVDGRRKLLDMLAIAGGISAEGSEIVNVMRNLNGETRREHIDVIELVRNGDLSRDYEVTAGDVIFVDRAPKFYITGEVQRPGSFRVERAMTVEQAISAGGGLTTRGTTRRMSITRQGGDGTSTTLDAKPNDLIRANDVITIKESWF